MDEAEEIDLRHYIAVLLRYWWLLVLGPVLAGAIGFGYARLQAPVYQASTRILVQQSGNAASPNLSDINLSSALANTYTELVRSAPVLERALEELGLPMSTNEFRRLISASVVRNTQILELRAEHTDPKAAADIANTTAAVFIDYTQQQRLAEIARLQAAAAAQGVLDTGSLVEAQLRVLGSLTIVDPAVAPSSPARPQVGLMTVLASLLGGLVAVPLAFLLHHLRDRVESPDMVEKRLGVASLGSVDLWTAKDGVKDPLVMRADPSSRFAEQIRHVRVNVQFSAGPWHAKSLVITSAGPSEGKTTMASNLAVALAQDGKRVVLIDADQRRASLHRIFDVPNTKGLSTYLALSQTALDEVVQPGGLPNLAVIPAGPHPPNPAELLGSPRLGKLIDELRNHTDFILLDSPPVLAVADAVLLASRMDGAILVSDAQRTKTGALAATLQRLQRANVRILGVVLDKAKRPRFSVGYTYQYYYDYSSPSMGTNGHKRIEHSGTGLRRWFRSLTARKRAESMQK